MSQHPFDLALIQETWGGPEDQTYRVVLGIFAPEAAELGRVLQAALARLDRPALVIAAHSLRGASGNVGAMTLADRASALEQAALHSAADRLGALLADTMAALGAVQVIVAAGGPSAHGA